IAAEHDWRLSTSRRRRTNSSRRRRTITPRRMRATRALTAGSGRTSTSGSTSTPQSDIFQRKTKTACGSAPPDAELKASDIPRTHRGVPGRLDLAGVVRGDAIVLAVVDQNIGVRDAGRRSVQIVDRRGLVGRTTPVIAVEPGIDLREIHGLGIDVFRTLDGVFGGNSGARIQ